MVVVQLNLWKFKKTGEEYANIIAYNLLHKAIPDMINGSIKELADLVFDYRFNMGSNKNCSFVYDGMMKYSDKLRILYENNDCDFLALSSVGPAFFAIISNTSQKEKCKKYMQEIGMNVIETKICNTLYQIVENHNTFWENKSVNKMFQDRPTSEYITNEIDNINVENKKTIDIGCGGGRYTKYLLSKGSKVLALDKYEGMFDKSINTPFIKGVMNKIPVPSNSYYLALSIGVLHNAITINEYEESLSEIYRILDNDGYALISTFTNDLITDDLIQTSANQYLIKGREPMVLIDKNQIKNIVKKCGFIFVSDVDEHITDVGGGKRNVYTFLLKK